MSLQAALGDAQEALHQRAIHKATIRYTQGTSTAEDRQLLLLGVGQVIGSGMSARAGCKGKVPVAPHYKVPTSQQGLQKFIKEAERIGTARKADPFHRASSFGGQRQAPIEAQKFIGGDGRPYVLLTQQATVNDQPGFFEYIVDSEGKITHQLFRRMKNV